MPVRTSGWTERHTLVAALVVTALGGCFVSLTEGAPVAYVVAAGIAVAAVVGLALDVWGGMLAGLAMAAAVVLVRRTTGHWYEDVFVEALLETCAVLVVGALAGHVGAALRSGGPEATAASPFEPAYGSLGLLAADAAFSRLAEEMERGERRQHPVVLMVLDAVVKDEALAPVGRTAALRAVARIVESRARSNDLPFALTADRFGVVFPETTVGSVWDVVGRILESASAATFTFGSERESRSLADFVDLRVGISQQSADRATAETLLDHALDTLARADRDEVGS